MVQVKRVYEAPAAKDGFRVLVDRLWPRGVSKERAALDGWLKEVAPSPGLRIWFGHDPVKFQEFSERYRDELSHNPAVAELTQLAKQHKNLTLLYAAKDPGVNHARVLEKFIQDEIEGSRPKS
jgi:uncharacterized protein YeaO (DUF488 family)